MDFSERSSSSTITRALPLFFVAHLLLLTGLKIKMARHLYRVLSSICLVAFGIALFLQIKELFSFSHRGAFFEQTLDEIQAANEELHPQIMDIDVTKLKTMVICIFK